MAGESIRLHRVFVPSHSSRVLLLVGIAFAALPAQILHAQTSAPAASGQPAATALQAQLKDVLDKLTTMRSMEVCDALDGPLSGDLTGVPESLQISALAALASAYERLAQDKRGDTLDPGAELKVQEFHDQAVDVMLRMGKVANDSRAFPSAEQAFKRALEIRPNRPQALLGLARAVAGQKPGSLLALENYEAYLRATKEERVPPDPALYVEVGKLYASANLWHQAMKTYREAERNKYVTPELYGLMAEATMQIDSRNEKAQKEKALEYANMAVSEDRENPDHYIRLVDLLLRAAQVDRQYLSDAREQAKRAIEVAGQKVKNATDEKQREEALRQTTDCYAVYFRVLTVFLTVNADDIDSRLAMVRAFQKQSEIQAQRSAFQALALLEVASVQDQSKPELLEEKIKLQKLAQVQPDKLQATCEELLKVSPDSALAKETLAALK